MSKFALLLMAALMMLAGPVFAEEAAGDWGGTLGNIRVALHLTKSVDGHYDGFMQSLDQGGAKIPPRRIRLPITAPIPNWGWMAVTKANGTTRKRPGSATGNKEAQSP